MYPTQDLAIIAPILFIVLIIAFPIIGIFAGWKRGLYWGGGNLVFFAIGLLIWRFCYMAIGQAFVPVIQQIIAGTGISTDLTNLSISLVSPMFFLIIVLGGNLILLINYYAWFKKVSGIKKQVEAKRAVKIAKQHHKQPSAQTIKLAGITTKARVMNMTFGFLALGALMVPTVISLTQATFFATTSAKTRKNNALAAGLYDMIVPISEKISPLSYYSITNTAKDYDAVFAALTLYNKKYYDKDGNEKSFIDATTDIIKGGFNNIAKTITEEVQPGGDKTADICQQVNGFAESWNSLLNDFDSKEDLTSLFNSESSTDIMSKIIDKQGESETKPIIDDKNFDENFAQGKTFDQMVEIYNQGYYQKPDGTTINVDKLEQIEVSEKCYDNIKTSVKNRFNIQLTDQEKIKEFDKKMDSLLWIIFSIPNV